ncbi:phosphatase [Bacillaceae bacterium SIJ1]|uniref:metallophosphoesterase family protein n=1 Tax=Litoribacterium kuwaitense TaxID=1398745 RepID=UPI0013EA8038|nr:metallophosphoesterase [Litoribacterium kuwaitense]NGP44525.1 phosphatase [Litoribacterium kuwaitense]
MSDNKPQKGTKVTNSIFENEMDRRTFIQKTSKVAGATLGLTLLGTLNSLPAGAASKSSVMKSNGKGPDLVFPVISDVHINPQGGGLNYFQNTLEQLNREVPNQDAFIVNGDLTDYGTVEEYDHFMNLYNQYRQTNAESMFTIGNHEYWNDLSAEGSQQRFCDKTNMESIYVHKVIKGYHFILLGTETIQGQYSGKQIEWLKKRLEKANADDWKKPIFVFHHFPLEGTIYGSQYSYDNNEILYNALKPYPQVISFSGHTHYPLDDPRIIHQKDFTSIGSSTGSYIWLDKGRIQGEVPVGASFLNQALIVEVHKNKVIIKRRDIHNDDWTGEPFEIRYPAKTNKFKYNEHLDKKAPFFTRDAMVSIDPEMTTLTSLGILVNQATDDLNVHDYKIVARDVETGEVANEFLAFSEFYKDPVPNPLPLPVRGLKPNTTYEIEVHAIDSYEKVSQNSLKVLGKTVKGDEVKITLSKETLNGTEGVLDVIVEHVRTPQNDWIGVYEEDVTPGTGLPSIWWMYTQPENGKLSLTYDPKENKYPDRFKEGVTYKMVYFYGSGYDAVASATFSVRSAE